ncbi:uncharacterized protein LOC121373481 [Gigantopelta aegis]|uniref:uncharacterized protein LOC121373481 n=1 Tax=Gigantopelta aegis TaxID=1735272 RepID=UPI001B88DD2B|nr:uncharacterized protein LOC121373481 [Gigantopelta aegis]
MLGLHHSKRWKKMLQERVERIQLKGQNFKCLSAATKDAINEFEDDIQNIDPELVKGQYQQVNVNKKQKYQDFLKTHCLERTYTFQTVHLLKGKTLTAIAEDQQGCKNSVLVGQNVRQTVHCHECGKPRCVYSKSSFTSRDTRSFKRLIESHDYTCGSILTPDGHILQGKAFVRLQMCCTTPIEFAYFASSSIVRKDVCCHCGSFGAERDKDLMQNYRVVLPVCINCKHLGSPKRNPIRK